MPEPLSACMQVDEDGALELKHAANNGQSVSAAPGKHSSRSAAAEKGTQPRRKSSRTTKRLSSVNREKIDDRYDKTVVKNILKVRTVRFNLIKV